MKPRMHLCVLALLVLTFSEHALFGQGPSAVKDLSEMSLDELMDVTVVSAARREQKDIDSPRSVSVVTAEQIRQRNYRTVPEALNEVVGVLVQETNYGGGAPVIRGLIGNQILVLVDGIRLNNAIFRLGPNQYLNTIDVNQVERIEVVRGVGSVLYGSDALGGLINIITKSKAGSPTDSAMNARAFGRFASADRSGVGRLEVSGNFRKLGFTGGMSLKHFGDLRAGGGTGLQDFTAYGEQDGDLKLSYSLSGQQNVVLAVQRVRQNNVSRTDVLLSGRDLKYEWNPQRRDLAYLQYEFQNPVPFISSLRVGVSYQNQLERFNRIQGAQPNTEREHRDEVQSKGFTIQLRTPLGERQLLTYGTDYYSDRVISRRVDVDRVSGVRTTKAGTFVDGSIYRSFAAFLQDEISVSESLSFNLGVRYSRFHTHAVASDSEVRSLQIDSHPRALTSSAYGMYKLKGNLGLFFGIAQGFRAPNIDDSTILGSFGVGFEVPNAHLSSEKSLNYEIGMKAQHNKFSGTVSYFISKYKDLIQRTRGTFGNLSFLDLNNNGIQDEGESVEVYII